MKKKEIAILSSILAFVIIFGGIVLYWTNLYRNTGLSLIQEMEEVYDYNGKLLVSPDGNHALLFDPLGLSDFVSLEKTTVSLAGLGMEEESFSYFLVGNTAINPAPAYEGFWPVSSPERFVFIARDGKKYLIHPKERLCYPMLSDSIPGVDPYGEKILAFSANGSYAISLEGDKVAIYHTDPMDDSLRIVDVKTVSLSDYGKDPVFGAFVGNTQAYFRLSGEQGERFVALDCATGEVAPSLFEEKGNYGEIQNRFFAQVWEEDGQSDRVLWAHLLLGTRWQGRIQGKSDPKIFAVSPQGTYAVARTGGDGEVFVVSEKRSCSLAGFLPPEERLEKVDFIYENIIVVTAIRPDTSRVSRCYKICF